MDTVNLKEFRVGSRSFSLPARRIYGIDPNRHVFQLGVPPPPRPLRYLLAWLPRCVRPYLVEWYLPASIVTKGLRGGKEEADFANEMRTLEGEMRDMYGQLAEHGVVHGDPELHNFLWTENGLVAVGFEFARESPDRPVLATEDARDDDGGVANEWELELNSLVSDIKQIIYAARPELYKLAMERLRAWSP